MRSYEDEVLVKYPKQIKGEEGEEESANSKLEAMGKDMGGDNPGPGY